MAQAKQGDGARVHCLGTLEDGTAFGSVMEKLLMADRRGLWDKPLTADELLIIGSEVLEPLFHKPPIGPIPEYLDPHWSVHGCVAEYEEKLEELDRWKALELNRWLKNSNGKHWCVAGKVHQLQVEKDEDAAPERFWYRLIEDRTEQNMVS